MKKVLLPLLLASTYSMSAFADCGNFNSEYSWCKGIPFDVTQAQYNSGISYHSSNLNSDYGTISAYEGMTSSSISMLQMLEKYAAEMEQGAEYAEFLDALYRAEDFNSDKTDNKAYAVVQGVNMSITGANGVREVYWGNDIIIGNDWDNNGRIDLFENMPGFVHRDEVIYPR